MEPKYGKIPEIKSGVVFSDPFYDGDVWCQYRASFSAQDWLMKMEASTEDGIVYFQLLLGRPTASRNVKAVEANDGNFRVSYPGIYDVKNVELGMDTACIYCGNMSNWKAFGESAALHTGTDGIFGDLMVFTCKGEDAPAGFLLMGALDETFGNEEDLFKHMIASFNGFEVSKAQYMEGISPDSLAYQLYAVSEAKSANVSRTLSKEDVPRVPER